MRGASLSRRSRLSLLSLPPITVASFAPSLVAIHLNTSMEIFDELPDEDFGQLVTLRSEDVRNAENRGVLPRLARLPRLRSLSGALASSVLSVPRELWPKMTTWWLGKEEPWSVLAPLSNLKNLAVQWPCSDLPTIVLPNLTTVQIGQSDDWDLPSSIWGITLAEHFVRTHSTIRHIILHFGDKQESEDSSDDEAQEEDSPRARLRSEAMAALLALLKVTQAHGVKKITLIGHELVWDGFGPDFGWLRTHVLSPLHPLSLVQYGQFME